MKLNNIEDRVPVPPRRVQTRHLTPKNFLENFPRFIREMSLMNKAREVSVRPRKDTPEPPTYITRRQRGLWRRAWTVKRNDKGSAEASATFADGVIRVDIQTRRTLKLGQKMREENFLEKL